MIMITTCRRFFQSIVRRCRLAAGVFWRADEPPRAYFSPNGGARQAILDTIAGARHSLLVAMFSFTDPEYGDALIAAHRRGVKVRVLLDPGKFTATESQSWRLGMSGVRVEMAHGRRLFHHKVVVADDRVVVTGSMNWTLHAEHRNCENVLIVASPEVARLYRRQLGFLS
ncbi:MAG: phospholipase D-like domain-containing protein [Planctomycetes bacterium]|nr:phospholipase D-like domain-containing protein [Planctomycetota bacterium]